MLLYFGYIGPFALLLIVNSAIIFKATQFQRSQRVAAVSSSLMAAGSTSSSKRKAEMTRTVYTITFFYIITTLPSSLVAGYYYGEIIMLPIGQMVVNIVNAVQSIYQSCNFFVLYFTNKLFAKELKILLSGMRLNEISMTSRSINNNNNTRDDSTFARVNTLRKSTIKAIESQNA